MAIPIKGIPTLTGQAAICFIDRAGANRNKRVSKEEYNRLLKSYKSILSKWERKK